MTRSPRSVPVWLSAFPPGLLALAVFALAYFSPIEEVHSDPAIALLATQALLDHGTLRLDAYRDDPACAYDLEHDYRIRRRSDSVSYFSHGVSLLSLPAVWLANRMGYHMLDQGDEFALQNLLSALCCALLAVLLYRICRAFLGRPASALVTSVSLFGSSLLSTMATGLWNLDYQVLLLALGLLHLVHRKPGAELKLGYLTLLAGLAFFCRPTAAFAVLAAILALAPTGVAPEARKRYDLKQRQVWLPLALGSALLAMALIALDLAEWMPRYYSPLKLTPQTPLLTGLYGSLLSPSRGLLVYSPFLLPVATACLWQLRPLAGVKLFRLAAVWSGLHLAAIATKGVWWGGHCYGPRLLAEVMLPAVLMTCLAWRQLECRRHRARYLFAAAYLACGLAAGYIHSYQGLFNPEARRWSSMPDIDHHPRLAFDWRYPQFLASTSSLEQRVLEFERRALGVYRLGEEIPFDTGVALGALFRDWYPPESGWRWSRGGSPEIRLRLGELPSTAGLYLFRLRAGSLDRQQIALEVNGSEVGRIELRGPVRERAFAISSELLEAGRENSFRLRIPGATSTAEDPRVMGISLHAFELRPLAEFPGLGFADEPLFVRGFSAAESRWRWTDGRRAAVDYPVADAAGIDTLELTARVIAQQRVVIRLNGVELGELSFDDGFDDVITRRLSIDPKLLRPFRMNRIELSLPDARRTADDPRLLGLAFVRLELHQGS